MFSTILLPPRAQLCVRYCSNKQQQQIYASHHGVLGSIPKREKTQGCGKVVVPRPTRPPPPIGLVSFQARCILPVAEEQSRTRGSQSSGVEDQPQCRGL
jgi:hypothetical protein